jgi:hypothetical protein
VHTDGGWGSLSVVVDDVVDSRLSGQNLLLNLGVHDSIVFQESPE